MTCAMCNGTGEITITSVTSENGWGTEDHQYKKPCPFGCKPAEGKTTGNTRISGKEKRLAKGQLTKMAQDPELVKEAQRLKKARKNIRKRVDGDYTITTYSIGLKDWYDF